MLKDSLGSGTLSAPEVILMRLTEAGTAAQKGVKPDFEAALISNTIRCEVLQPCPHHMCWQMLATSLRPLLRSAIWKRENLTATGQHYFCWPACWSNIAQHRRFLR